ncbi:MAG TPA: hypothetical protein VFU68_02070 [Terracidiphilus sp.]|nr:hypothetical protein [Terracidiphilus sp.]
MKSALLIAIAAVTVSSFPLFAHQAPTGAQSPASASAQASSQAGAQSVGQNGASANSAANLGAAATAGNASAGSSANGSGSASAAFTPMHAQLMHPLDSKSAREGQPVEAKTTQPFRTANGVVIPKGSRLMGHVTQVQAHGHGQSNSSLGLVFDQAQLKGGQTVPIRSVIESVSPSASAVAMANAEAQDSMDSAMPAMGGGGGAMGGGSLVGGGGSGLVGGSGGALAGGGSALAGGGGGLANSALHTTGSATGSAAGSATGGVSGLGSSANGALNSTTNAAAGTMGGLHGAVNQTSGAMAGLGSHATGIPGVMLNSTLSGNGSGVLSATGRNVHLDSGTQMVLGVAAAASH